MHKKQTRPKNHDKPRSVVGPDSVPGDDQVLNFSFKYFDKSDKNFPITDCDIAFMLALLERMQYYGEMSIKDFVYEDSKEKRHILYWPLNDYKGFPGPDPNEIGAEQSWQFCLHDGDKHHATWRIHGFLRDNTFHVVWFDPNHFLTIESSKSGKSKRK